MKERDLSKNVVVAHINSEPSTLHPTNGTGVFRSFIFQYTQKRLMRPDLKTLETIPELIDSMPIVSEDGLEYTYSLKDGIQWDDGTPFTIDDVIFTIKMNKCPLTDNTSIRSFYSRIESVKPNPEDSSRFTMICNEKYYGNSIIFETGLWMMQKDHWDPHGVMEKFSIEDFNDPNFNPNDHPDLQELMEDFNSGKYGREPEHLVGLGPYDVTSWKVGNSITLERKQDWWGANTDHVYNRQYPKKIIFKVIRDDFAAGLALRRQSIDVTTQITTEELLKARQRDYFNEQFHSDFVKRFGYQYIGLNMRPDVNRNPYFTNRKVRRAMAHLVPVNEIMQVLSKNKGIRQASFISPLKEAYNDELDLIQKNIEKACRLLKEAGWEDSDGDNVRDKIINGEKVAFKFQLNYIKSGQAKQTALMIKDIMYEAGVVLEPNGMDFSVFYSNARNHDFDAMLGSWSSGSSPNDPEQIWHTKNWANNGSNFTGFGNAKSDSLIELANRTLDKKEREAIMKKLQKIVYEDQPYIFLYSPMRKTAIHKRFDNAGMYNERPGVILNNLKLKEGLNGAASLPGQISN